MTGFCQWAKVRPERIDRESEIGPNEIGAMNENGKVFADFCLVYLFEEHSFSRKSGD